MHCEADLSVPGFPPREFQRGPVAIDRTDLVVDQIDRETGVADVIFIEAEWDGGAVLDR